MTLEELKTKIIDTMKDSLDEEAEICDDTNFMTDLGLSSMQMMIMVGDLEDELGIEIPVSRLSGVETFGDFFEVIVAILRSNQ